jgi:hypothetical protein
MKGLEILLSFRFTLGGLYTILIWLLESFDNNLLSIDFDLSRFFVCCKKFYPKLIKPF